MRRAFAFKRGFGPEKVEGDFHKGNNILDTGDQRAYICLYGRPENASRRHRLLLRP